MEDLTQQMAAIFVPALVAVLGTLVTVGMARLNKWLKMKAGSQAMEAAGDLVAATVNELSATLVKDIKANASDGKLSLQEAQEIKAEAMKRINKQLPSAVKNSAALVVADMEEFLKGKIEQTVAESK